ncbi:GNAT family N-acetyltransferase [Actinocatenispora sera]|uniref:GNAT family N-acetyltransferase n=1 Tax=Actinocatenispora sera TaxID=390989 RepID=UPI0033F7E211
MSDRITLTALTETGSHPRLVWLAADPDGCPVGSAYLRLFDSDGRRHLGELSVAVHPARRRQGTGTALLAALVAAARADGRRSLLAEAHADTPGDAFLAARGFRRVLQLIYTRLSLADVDRAALTAEVATRHPGYRLVSWRGTVPDELAASFAASRRAMDDMPLDDTDYGTVHWDVEAVRDAARAIADRGEHLDTVAVATEDTGEIVGFTELVVGADGTGDGQHYGTGVLPEHRGHGLARWMKAAAIDRAAHRYPRLSGLLADTASSNGPMRRINADLGYRHSRVSHEYQLDL